MADKDEINESGGNGTNLSNPSASTRSTGTDDLTSRHAKRGGGNTKKGVKDVKNSDYPIPATKKAFNYLRHVFTQASIFQHFDPKRHIRIKTDVLGYAIDRFVSQLILDDLGR